MISRALAYSLLLFYSMVSVSAGESTIDSSVAVKVNAMNYVRAKTALQLDKYYARAGGINRFSHSRNVVGIDNRSSKRLNRDTLYSVAIVDISEGAVVEMPKAAGRYMSLQV
ncbi:MAG: DUF1254 domain-containing protein, partial [Halioglobus sp.]